MTSKAAKPFDNRNALRGALLKLHLRTGSQHFVGDIDGRRLVYCYIRKNACSSFKALLVDAHEPSLSQMAGSQRNDYLRRFCSARFSDARDADHLIFVFRDPFERAVSIYVNKFVQRSGATGMMDSYRKVTGCKPETATFDDYLHKYLSHNMKGLDPHVRPQKRHLWPIQYTDAVPITRLKATMAGIIGEDRAETYFGKATNATTSSPEIWPNGIEADRIPGEELRSTFLNAGTLPPKSAFLTTRSRRRIEDLYREDLVFADSGK